ncbi:hypothetical protein EDF35_1919 [Rathayibacter sp. PhB151]|uniref:hypothetical protein n=1 Tax=Rathayibacter sp. PhB151 TaxID=2485189 RepID=UPI0010644DCB|nr:hypothetical protein [Rathayibacter sp. PhB151]TDX78705.1 hypothetical protein EDF35_1919 [Rathayibacter sp. PhB151]
MPVGAEERLEIDYFRVDADRSITVTRPAPDGNRIWITARPGRHRRATWRTGDQYGSGTFTHATTRETTHA